MKGEKEMAKIINATADYTGGGCYLYTGDLGCGLYFMAATDWMDYVLILNADPNDDIELASTDEWQNEHRWAEMTGSDAERFLGEVFDFIIINAPDGNYCTGDIIEAKSKLTTADKTFVNIHDGKVVTIHECYAPADDTTFIMREVEEQGVILSREVIGFYSGEPDAEATKTYMGKTKAEYEN